MSGDNLRLFEDDPELHAILLGLGFPNGSIPVPVPPGMEPQVKLAQQVQDYRVGILQMALMEGISPELRRAALEQISAAVGRALKRVP